jgi:hypothetical protein
LNIIQDNFNNSIQAHSQFNVTANRLDEMRIDAKEVTVFTEILLPDTPVQFDDKGKEIKKRETSRIPNRRNAIVDLFATGAGNRGNSRWDAFNAVTEYVDHHNNSKSLEGKNAFKAAERRFVSNLLGGPGDRLKQRALGLLLNRLPFYAQQDAAVYTAKAA